MMKLRRLITVQALATYVGFIQVTNASPTTIKYDALKKIDGMPSLGRGYSITTNSFHSSCFNVNGTTTEHSYNFDCKLCRHNHFNVLMMSDEI